MPAQRKVDTTNMYRQLLLSTGGGILSNIQKDAQEACVTLAIGLGGTGVSCLRNLKRQVYDRLQADDPNAEVPTYSHIKFLAVDTDRSSLEADGKINSLDESTEFFDISSTDIQGLLASTKVLAGQPELDWLQVTDPEHGKKGLTIFSATAGAGGVRQIGRLLLIQKSDQFVHKVSLLVNDAKRGFPTGVDVNVHIFAGMGGGTGSGTFLDVCYLVQKALNDIGEGGHALTFGYFFLPDVNLSVPQIAAMPAVSKYISSNGFSAMKELDYCMNLEVNGGKWEQQYHGFHFGPVRNQPVNCCHLISANAINGATLAHGYDYAMNVVTDFIMQFLVKNDINMTTHIANYGTAMGMVSKSAGANYKYILLGASNAVVPTREIMTYLASKLFEAISDIKDKTPTDADIEKFAQQNDLTVQGLLKQVMAKTSYNMPAIELDMKMFREMTEQDLATPDQLILPATIMDPYRNLQNRMLGIVETNTEALTHAWNSERIREEQDNISRVWKTYYSLEDVVQDPDRGPFYASVILNGSGRKNLVDILRGDKKAVQNQIQQISADLGLRMQQVKAARTAFLHPGFMANRSKLFAAFVASVANYYTCDSQIKVLEKMEIMLQKMIEQFINLYSSCFEPYQKVIQKLITTFHENYRTLSDGTISSTLDDPFIMPLLKMDENMWEQLDKTVSKLNLAQEKQNFNSAFFKADKIWSTDDERKITKFVSDYFTATFAEYTVKTITNYLEMRFNTTDPQQLQNKTFMEIMRPLSQMATPLFWKSGNFQASQGNIGYISVPEDAAVITSAAQKLINEDPNLRMVKSSFANRIFLLRCLCGVPLYAYNGTELYEQEYSADTSEGKHLYLPTERNSKNWSKLPNLRPYSTIQHPTEEMIADEELYERAVKEEIVRPNPAGADYQLVEFEALPNEIKEAAEDAIHMHNMQNAKNSAEAVKEYLANREPVKRSIVLNDGMMGHEEKVRKDHVMESSVMMEAIRRQLAIIDDTRKLISRLEEVKPDPGADTFRNAVYTGVFDVAVNKITFTKTKYGMKKEIILMDVKTQPYGMSLPLYQAYVSFSSLPDEEKQEIQTLVENKLANLDTTASEMKAVCDKLQRQFSEAYMGMMQMNAARFPDEQGKIEQFFLNFMQGLENFRIMYQLDLFS